MNNQQHEAEAVILRIQETLVRGIYYGDPPEGFGLDRWFLAPHAGQYIKPRWRDRLRNAWSALKGELE